MITTTLTILNLFVLCIVWREHCKSCRERDDAFLKVWEHVRELWTRQESRTENLVDILDLIEEVKRDLDDKCEESDLDEALACVDDLEMRVTLIEEKMD